MKHRLQYLTLILVLTSLALPALGQRRAPRTTTEYGVTLTFAVYGYDQDKSQTFDDHIRLSTTFSTSQEEINFIRDRYGAEEMALRHVRSIGLAEDESFTDTQRIGPDFMVVAVEAKNVNRAKARFDITARYGQDVVLEKKDVPIENFETIVLKGKAGMFGLRTFVGPGGVNESTSSMQTLLMSITAEIAPLEKVPNRPRDLSHPTDAHGTPLKWEAADKYQAPIVLNRVEPTLPLRRPLAQGVLLEGIITPEGKVTNVRVLRSLEAEIDKLAIDAFRRYQFQGAKLNGAAVHATWREEVTFRIPGL